VYVLLPLLPAFEGEIGTNTGTAIQAVVNWNYLSICRGGKSLLERLYHAGGVSVLVCCCPLVLIVVSLSISLFCSLWLQWME